MLGRHLRIGWVLTLALASAAAAAACGSNGSHTTSGFSGSGASGNGGANGGAGNGASGTTSSGISLTSTSSGAGAAAGFDVQPATLQTITVVAGQAMPTVPYVATLDGQPASAGWGVDKGNIGTIPAGPGTTETFVPSGTAGGLVTITASLNKATLTRQVVVKLTSTQNGPNGSPSETAQIPMTVADLTNGGGVGGVGGEGLGPAVGDPATVTALGAPAGNGQAQGLGFLYPYDKTVWPRGMLAPLLMWDWSTGDADAVKIDLKTTTGSFTYSGMFGRPAILTQTGGKFIRMPIPQDVWDMATNTAGGSADKLTVSLTVAKGGVAYGPISETWTVAAAHLSGTIYYNSYGTQLAHNAGGAVGGNGQYGGAVLSIRVGDTGPKLVAGDDNNCRVCHSVAAFGSRLVVSQGGNYSARSDYDLTPAGATEHPLNNQGAWFPGVYPDGSRMLTGDGTLLPLPSDATPLPVSGLTSAPAMPAFSPDGKFVAFNPGLGPTLVVMAFDVTTGTFSSPTTVVSAVGGLTPGWPAFFPDGKSVVFEDESATGYDGHGSGILWTRGGAKGKLAWASAAGGAPATLLSQLNGEGYLPKLATPSVVFCTGDGNVTSSTNPAHDDDVDVNYEPTVNPIGSGGYAWVVFTSRRMYGSEATIPPFCSDPRGVDLIKNVTPKKLWVAAVDLSQAPGTDASHPAFYLPAQELLAGNSRGFWALDPCEADGASCTSGDQCCNGYCEPNAMGMLVCANTPPMGTCSGVGDKCTTAADCCDPNDACINGFCTVKTPQ